MKATAEDIVSIVGLDEFSNWAVLDPTVYLKDGESYGLIAGAYSDNGINYIAATVESAEMPFTVGMLRDIIKVIREENVCIITDDKRYIGSIKKALSRFNMRFVVEGDVLYSYNDKEISWL